MAHPIYATCGRTCISGFRTSMVQAAKDAPVETVCVLVSPSTIRLGESRFSLPTLQSG